MLLIDHIVARHIIQMKKNSNKRLTLEEFGTRVGRQASSIRHHVKRGNITDVITLNRGTPRSSLLIHPNEVSKFLDNHKSARGNS